AWRGGLDRMGARGGGAGGWRPERDETLDGLARGADHDGAVARLDQPASHGKAHLAEPNEADIHRRPSLDAPFWSFANLPRRRGCSHVRASGSGWNRWSSLRCRRYGRIMGRAPR